MNLCDTCQHDCACASVVRSCSRYVRADKGGADTATAQPSKATVKREKELQNLVQNWLRRRGYFYRSSSDILAADMPPRGWQYHLHRTRLNGYLLDMLLLGNDGRYLEFELKVEPVRYAGDEQRALVEKHGYKLFTTFESVREYVLSWEAENGNE